jgi:hypothetical protein
MSLDWSRILPKATLSGEVPLPPYCFLIAIAAVSTARSLIHMFAPDGGAHSIAGIDIDVAGGANLIALFAQWGASQLLLAILYWIVIVRYRFLTPLMLSIIVVEQLLRLGMGKLKPLQLAAPPPGAYYTGALLPIAAVMLIWSIWPSKTAATNNRSEVDEIMGRR